MHTPGHDDDPWAEYRARREAWREQRRARREAWREAWRARRDERRERWHAWGMGMGHGWGHHGGWSHRDPDMGPARSGETEAMKAKVADMQKTIDQLLERVAVLEKLATDDDTKLAREIERLRETDPRT